MNVTFVLGISVFLQFVTAVLALRLIRVTGRRVAWILIASAISLMAVRRLIPLLRLLSGNLSPPPDLTNELVGLIISTLMLTGVAWIAPLFLSIKSSEEELRKHHEQLEERTAKLTRLSKELQQEITEHKRAEEVLYRCKQEFKALVENEPDIIARFDREFRHVYVNPAVERATGMRLELFIGKTNAELGMPEEFVSFWHTNLCKVFETGQESTIEFIFPTPNSSHYYHSRLVPEFAQDGSVEFVISIARDLTEHKEKEKKIRDLASQLALIEEKERRNIATDLHDHVGQLLSLSKIKLKTLMDSSFSLSKPLKEILQLIEQLLQYTRTLTFELSPPILYELGLQAAIEWLAEEMQKQHNFVIEVIGDCQETLNDEIRSILFKAVKELLVNVVKHARANKVKISLAREKDVVRIDIKDDGIGFVTSGIDFRSGKISGFGLFNIYERLNHLGGSLEAKSELSKGTQVTLTAPLTLGKMMEE